MLTPGGDRMWLVSAVAMALLLVTVEAKADFRPEDVTALTGEKFDYQIGNEEFLSVYSVYKIVQRGHKKLPEWLTYDTNSSMLIGYPEKKDVGKYTLKIRAQCKDPSKTQDCQDKLSRTMHINVLEPLASAESRAAPDREPTLNRSIDHLEVIVGRYFYYRIPVYTFFDKEEGNTRNLSLNISLIYGKPMPSNAWLIFNASSQTLYGIPMKSDLVGDDVISKFILYATDSQNQVAKDAISITYRYDKVLNHRVSLELNGSYGEFLGDRTNLIQVAQNVAKFYEDKNMNFITFASIEKGPSGSVVVSWGNNSLFGTICLKKHIQDLYDELYENGSLSSDFVTLFRGEFVPVSATLQYVGVCLLPMTTSIPPEQSSMDESKNDMWLEILLPALIAILIVVIIAILLLICCRHKQPKKDIKNSDKPAFLEDRQPIIFPEELEMVDPSLKPKTPLVLPSDYMIETPPAVPPHGRADPPYPGKEDRRIEPGTGPEFEPLAGDEPQTSSPPPYRLPPPYFNPHRVP